MTYSIPTRDDDSITARLTSRQANTIRHIVPLDDLLLLTSDAEWRVNTGGKTGPITPTDIDNRVQGYVGASSVRPVVTSNSVIYAQDRGGRVREMLYSWESNKYDTRDISIMAPHLFDGYTIVGMAYAHAPHKTLWCVRSDGVLLGLTYVPEHKVAGWHQHNTDGLFESVCVVPEGNEDVPYFIVKRTINSVTKRLVERLHTRFFDTLADCFFVDCGLTYSGAPTTNVTNLWHLEGKTVSILTDGAVLPPQVVTGGTLPEAFPAAASKVHVGLPITADFQTLPPALEMPAFGQGYVKNVNRVSLRVDRSSGILVGPSFTKLREAKQRTVEPYGAPPALKTGVVPVVLTPTWGDDAAICVRQAAPLPLTILGLVPDISVGG